MNLKKIALNSIMFISAVCFTTLFMIRTMPIFDYIINPIIASGIWGYFIFYKNIVFTAFKNVKKPDIIVAGILTIAFVPFEINQSLFMIGKCLEKFSQIEQIAASNAIAGFIFNLLPFLIGIYVLLCALTFFSIIAFVSSKVLSICVEFFKNLDSVEKPFLEISFAIFAILTIWIFSATSLFHEPVSNSAICHYDALLRTDTGVLTHYDCFINPQHTENDLKQPLFGVFSMPFALFAKLVSWILFFIPNAYYTILNIIQVGLILITALLYARIAKLQKLQKLLFCLFYVSSFPFILFALNMEQYIFAMFWLAIFMYVADKNKSAFPPLLVAATGSLTTSCMMALPLLAYQKSTYAQKFFTLLKSVGLYVVIMICFGLFRIARGALTEMNSLNRFREGIGFEDRLIGFTHFVKNCFFAPDMLVSTNDESLPCIYEQLMSQPSILGITILVICILGYLMSYKLKFANLAAYWILFSFFITVIIGWGSMENSFFLYSLYFSWGFIGLTFFFFDKIFKNKIIKICAFALIILTMLYLNINSLLYIIEFGIKNYQ